MEFCLYYFLLDIPQCRKKNCVWNSFYENNNLEIFYHRYEKWWICIFPSKISHINNIFRSIFTFDTTFVSIRVYGNDFGICSFFIKSSYDMMSSSNTKQYVWIRCWTYIYFACVVKIKKENSTFKVNLLKDSIAATVLSRAESRQNGYNNIW